MGELYGYFKWAAHNGKVYPSKYIKEGESFQPDTKAYYERSEIAKWPLDALEWELSLDELSKKYPCPDDWRAIMAKKGGAP